MRRPLLVLSVLTACATADSSPVEQTTPIHRRVADLIGTERPYVARLSGSTTWRPCTSSTSDPSKTGIGCGSYRPVNPAITQASEVLARSGRASEVTDLDRAWSAAVVDLAARPNAEQLDALIERLSGVAEGARGNTGARNDVAVAYLARHEFRRDGMSLFLALDNIEAAIDADSASPVIRFNRAIILHYLHLYEEERVAWEAVIAREGTSSWAAEAREHIAELDRARRSAGVVADSSAIATFATRDPQAAREWVLNQAIGAWATAAARGDVVRAASVATQINAVRDIIEQQSGDSSLRHVVAPLNRASPAAVNAMAQFADGAQHYVRGDLAAAGLLADSASIKLRRLHADAAADWADGMSVGVLVSRSRFADAERRARAIARSAKRRGDIALEARAYWLLALGEAREGKATPAVADYRSSGSLYGKIGELANEGSTFSQQGEVIFQLGQDDAALELQYAGLGALANYRKPKVRAGPMLATARQLEDVGLKRAALEVLRDAATSAIASERNTDRPEALIRLATAEFAAGANARGKGDLVRAREALKAVTDSIMRERMSMELNTAEAMMLAQANDPSAVRRFDDVAGFFRRGRIFYDLPAPLIKAATLRLTRGDTAAAEGNLAEALATLEAQTIKPGDVASARAVAQARRQAYGELVAIHVARQDTVGAFLLAERSRGNRISRVPTADVLSLAYTVRPRETLLWIVLVGEVRLVRVPVTEEQLADLVAGVEGATRGAAHVQSLPSASRDLYALLVAPAEREMASAREVRVVPDGVLARLPFAELRGGDGKFLVEHEAVSYALSTQGGVSWAPRASRRADEVVVASNPRFDATLFPELQPLRAASEEARSVRESYGRAAMLEDSAVTKRAFVQALRSARLVHFAGHARLVSRAPALSHLVLARSAGGVTENALSAAEIEAMDLRRLDLVVLSACGTTQAASRRSGSENGLSRAFLDAGAGAVVSSLWEADDESTAALMSEFHRNAAAGMRPAEALRVAQVKMLSSGAERSEPRYWSAFRVETR